MPKLVCRACGRQIYTVAPLDALFAEERRCPRCGAPLAVERRGLDRRHGQRRLNPTDDPGPPPDVGEQREGDRRYQRRRADDGGRWPKS